MVPCEWCGHDIFRNDEGGNCIEMIAPNPDQPEVQNPCDCGYHQPEDQERASADIAVAMGANEAGVNPYEK